jgi:pyridinium-3,5-bisthiocarboxylic acid mononucleotide nickel chelatase
MKIAYFDTIGGISGDMTLGAFISAGVSFDELNTELQALGIQGFELQVRHIVRNGITAVKIDVVISQQPHYHRHLKDIEELIDKSSLATTVKERAKKIFREVAIAEAQVHNSTIEKVHFHEVGAIDSLVDIIGVAICLDKLGVEAVYTSQIKVGNGGFVQSQHGRLPIPTPATMEILKNYPINLTAIPYELATPTGAAIVKALSSGMLSTEKLKVESIGYGAGGREIEEVPNLLRIMIGSLEPEYATDELVSVETNIDDMNPEIFPYVIEKLLAAGANDAYITPVVMKKGRPGMLLSTLVERGTIDTMLDILFKETSTIGVRIQPVERKKLLRSNRQTNTSLGVVTVKAIEINGKEHLRPEFEECKRIALERQLPLLEVYKIIEHDIR